MASKGYSPAVVCGLLAAVASLVVERGEGRAGFSSCGARAELLCGMWNLPRPGIEPMFLALAGGFPHTVPPGSPDHAILYAEFL